MRDTFVRTTAALLDDDPHVALVLADISAGLFDRSAARHPERVLNVGIREQLMVGVAGGLALSGLRPVVHTYAPFLVERAYEQIKLDLVHQDVGAVLVSVGASYDSAGSGRTHHAPGDVALLDGLAGPDARYGRDGRDGRNGLSVHVPGHPAEVERLLRAAVSSRGLSYIRLSEQQNAAPSPAVDGTLHVVRRGRLATVVAVGPTLDRVVAATEGLDLTVLHAVTVRPLDTATLLATIGIPDVVLVEPYLAGTSVRLVDEALVHVPHRVLGLGVGRGEQRRYGTPAEHDEAHGLDEAGLRRSIGEFLAPR